jgi:hypothetical protein
MTRAMSLFVQPHSSKHVAVGELVRAFSALFVFDVLALVMRQTSEGMRISELKCALSSSKTSGSSRISESVNFEFVHDSGLL